MRKIIFVLALVALFGMVGNALSSDEYPPELAGGQFLGEEHISASLFAYDWTPYSFPLAGDDFYIGDISSSNATEISVHLGCLARHPLGECLSPAPWQYRNFANFQWNAGAQCYMYMDLMDDGRIHFQAWQYIENGRWTWWTGCLEAVPGHPLPDFEFDDACGLFLFEVNAHAEALKFGGANAGRN